jgi:hypothetical protein
LFVLLLIFSHVNRAKIVAKTPTEKSRGAGLQAERRRRCKTKDGAAPPLSFSDKI